MLKTHIAFCIDESGSVSGIVNSLIKAYNKNVDSIRNAVLDQGQEATMTALAFGDRNVKHRVLYVGQQVQTVTPLKDGDIRPSGMTPLFDSLYRAIKKLEELDDGKEDTTFVVTVVTDGEENASFDPGKKVSINLMKEKIKTDRWTFTFLVPQGYASWFSRKYDIPIGNIHEWETTTAVGTETAFITNSAAYSSYFVSKSAGMKSTRSFYADIPDLTVRKARTELSKITKQVEIIDVKNECTIRDAIEQAGKPFIKGAAFYQLVKPEKRVQPYKMIALRVKTSGEIYTGSEARIMLGIDVPNTIRLAPGDHGKFDIFIQSTSYTRKIPAGTQVLYWPKVGTQAK